MAIIDAIKKLFRIPYYYRAELTTSTMILGKDQVFDAGKHNTTSISFSIPENTGSINYDTVRIKGIDLFPGKLRSFKTEVPHLDKTKYEIVFLGVAGTQPVLQVYITSVSKYVAVQPSEFDPCDKV